MCLYGGRGGVQLSDGRWKDGMCAKEGNQGMFFFYFYFFLFSRGRWKSCWRGVCWERETKPDIIVRERERETCVLLCLDVSFIFFTKLLAVIAWWRCESCERGSAIKSQDGECVCAEAKMDHELISVKKTKNKIQIKNTSKLMMLDCTEGSNCICN